MTKLLSKPHNLTGFDRLLDPKPKHQIFKVASSRSKAMGSSLIELLLATALALFAASTAAQLINSLNTSGLNRRAAATSAIEIAISNDLAWFRQYAVLWQLERGPYETLPKVVTQTDYEQIPSPNPSNLSNKYKEPTGCSTSASTSALANAFQKDAAKLKTDFDAIKKPPYDIPNGASTTTFDLPKSASGYMLERKIQPNDDVSGTLTITYTLSKSGTTIFERSSSVYLPAAGWCT
jgi:hypothetical protein